MPLGIGLQPEARLGDRALLADAGEHVGERPPLRRVVEHVVDGDQRRAGALAEFVEQPEPARLVAAIAVHAGEEGAPRRCAGERGEALAEGRRESRPAAGR